MAQRNARLQVPIDQTVLDQLEVIADELGFDSVPAMVRFWAKGEIVKRSQARGFNRSNSIVLRYVELILAMHPEPPTVHSALSHLKRQINRAGFKKAFPGLSNLSSSDKIFDT